MRIRLKSDARVDPRHGREFDVLEENGKPRYEPGMWGFAFVMGDAGEEIKVWGREFEIVESQEPVYPVEEGHGPKLQT